MLVIKCTCSVNLHMGLTGLRGVASQGGQIQCTYTGEKLYLQQYLSQMQKVDAQATMNTSGFFSVRMI